ncbi:MAG: hypothetical protein ABEJ91_03265 [Candidatus Nanohaloarchaea archaeon]
MGGSPATLDDEDIVAGNRELYLREDYVIETGVPDSDYGLSRELEDDPLEGTGNADDGFRAMPESNW